MRLLHALVVVAVGCGGATKRAPIESRGGDGAAAHAMTDPVVVLRALAAAAENDDGAALDALVHPTYGMWLWDQPGAYVSPTLHVIAGGGEAPTTRLAASDMNDYWKENFWSSVAGGLDALDRMDRDPADRYAPIYGDCGEEDQPHDLRAWLASRDSFHEHYDPILQDTNHAIAPALMADGAHYRVWGLDVWLVEDHGRLWVAHVMVWTPCDA